MNELAEAITDLVTVKIERDLAYSKCEVDPDYFCSSEDDRVTYAVARMRLLLTAVIDERVDARLGELREQSAIDAMTDA